MAQLLTCAAQGNEHYTGLCYLRINKISEDFVSDANDSPYNDLFFYWVNVHFWLSEQTPHEDYFCLKCSLEASCVPFLLRLFMIQFYLEEEI